MHILTIEDVCVEIGQRKLLKNISFSFETGKVIGLVGHNGAGKSTLLKTIMGTQEKKFGKIFMGGDELDQDEQPVDFKRYLSYLPEEPMLLSELTVEQHFQLYGISYELSAAVLEEKVQRYIEGFELTDRLKEYPSELSKGMRQKVQTICAFLPDVPFILMDEPFMGLDVYAIEFLIQIISEKAKEGKGILLTTHQLDQVKELADEFIMLQQGELKRSGPIEEFESIQRGQP